MSAKATLCLIALSVATAQIAQVSPAPASTHQQYQHRLTYSDLSSFSDQSVRYLEWLIVERTTSTLNETIAAKRTLFVYGLGITILCQMMGLFFLSEQLGILSFQPFVTLITS